MELSRPAVVQHCGHLTLTLALQGQIRDGADWCGSKLMTVTFNFDLTMTLTLNFNPKFWNSSIQVIGGSIDIERKGYESIGCYTYFVALS